MSDITIRRGETLELTIVIDDPHAYLAKFLVASDDDGTIIEQQALFSTVDGVTSADIVIPTSATNQTEGEYEYMLTIVYDDDVIEKLPDGDCCGDDCELPKFIICKSLEEVVS